MDQLQHHHDSARENCPEFAERYDRAEWLEDSWDLLDGEDFKEWITAQLDIDEGDIPF